MSFRVAQDLIPELILLLGAMACAALGAARPRTGMRMYMVVAGFTLVAAAGSSLVYLRGMPPEGYSAYSAGLIVDRYALFATVVLCGFSLLTVFSGDTLRELIGPNAGEYHALVLTATLGAVLMASAREMIALFVAIELLSVSLYVLVALVKTDRRGSEAAFKYLILGATSSAVLLYGLAILYGVTGSTVLTDVAHGLTHTTGVTAVGIALVLAGLGFKLGAVPFQQWVPDVYEGAPAPVAGLIASLSKTAGFALVARLAVTSFPASSSTWTAVIATMAAASMVYGNLAALAQTRMRRLLGYSSIGQAGFLLLGVLAWHTDQQGIGATLFYLATYGITIVGAFAAVGVAEARGVGPLIADYRGLSRRSPVAASMFGVAMVSLIGIPPVIGFFAKLFVFEAAVTAGFAWLVVIAVVMTVVSAGYYLRVLRVVFIDAPDEGAEPIHESPPLLAVLGVCLAATAFLGILTQPLLALATGGSNQLH